MIALKKTNVCNDKSFSLAPIKGLIKLINEQDFGIFQLRFDLWEKMPFGVTFGR